MIWLKRNWHWGILNLLAGSIFVYIWTQGSAVWNWNTGTSFSTMIESGKWAIRFLLFCLTVTPLNTYFGWRSAIKLRKPAGLWAFGFAGLHFFSQIQQTTLFWSLIDAPFFIVLGYLGLIILVALAVTSNRRAMKFLGKTWKRLHRSVYLGGVAVISHAIQATSRSKMLIGEPEMVREFELYLAVLVVLLAVRIPLVARLLKRVPVLLLKRRPVALPEEPRIVPQPLPDTLPIIYQRDAEQFSQGSTEEDQPEETHVPTS